MKKMKTPIVQHPLSRAFGTFASAIATAAGSRTAFTLALISLVVWAFFGPFFGYSETSQLVINTGTTIVTFMMVFVIQNSQNRESLAVQISSMSSSGPVAPRTAPSILNACQRKNWPSCASNSRKSPQFAKMRKRWK